jgi:hypothetical protein
MRNGSSSITKSSWPSGTSAPSTKCLSWRKPFTRARISTVSIGWVSPLNSRYSVTARRVGVVTVTSGGGGGT